MNILVLDTETTGLDPERHALVQISASVYSESGEKLHSFSAKVSYSYGEIDLAALKVNKVKVGMLSSYGNPELNVMIDFCDFLLTVNDKVKDLALCGMNVAFDVGFLKEAACRHSIKNLEALLPRKTLDTQIIALALKVAGVIEPKSTKSEDLYDYFGISKENIHSADEDVKKTAELYFKLREVLQNARRVD